MTADHLAIDAHGIALVLEVPTTGLPCILHWGPSLGAVSADDLALLAAGVRRQAAPGTLDAAWQISILPAESDGWTGRPGLQVRTADGLHRPRWQTSSARAAADTVVIEAVDTASALTLRWAAAIETGGVVWVDVELRNGDGPPVELEWLEPTLPVPTGVTHLTTFDGRWTREKRPVTTPVPAGAVARQSRRGRPGHDAPTAALLTIGEPRWTAGEVWGTHLAWSSDATYRTDRVTDSSTLVGAGELLRPGEIVLQPGETYRAPRAAFVWSAEGLDGFAQRVHAWLRVRPQHPSSPRPLTLNTWEAVYFDHDPARLLALADTAATVGIERFVLDDGWFQGRRDDSTSLGDWVVDRTVWPDGLEPLADRVHALGMQFGLWFEPEMVSLDSDLARAHPEWLLHDAGHLSHDPSLSWRGQYVLNLAHPDAYAHVRDQMSELIAALGIDFIKWDHNRDLVDSVHDGRPGVHAQMLATYRLIRELKVGHPGLEIESCSSGGARTDLGILEVTDRVWASDSNDPVERQDIQRWTGLLLPPELVGAHVGPAESHSSGRTTDLSYRMATSLLGSAGFECDIQAFSDDERETAGRFAALYRELRPIIHRGAVSHPELRDPAWRVTMFTAPDAAEAVVVAATVRSLEDARAERLRLPGVDRSRRYRVRVRDEIGAARSASWVTPEWFSDGGIELPGSVLADVGLQLPALWPAQAFVLHATAV
ncbi:alpha-galactosidase [Microbacterium terricola]|uniref:alpha-galactosidase n=1 Tax=Microbacterium terricola TaxID=344163 RepID=A0ABM8DW88_9MICO|nr:alpha-galactosidase [Microbacterium terricola]UYK39349.1 alpha-galactosidase [Microbacterium terricola]BDV29928.1 alpha-galactosidase [Microbacterium terricola]